MAFKECLLQETSTLKALAIKSILKNFPLFISKKSNIEILPVRSLIEIFSSVTPLGLLLFQVEYINEVIYCSEFSPAFPLHHSPTKEEINETFSCFRSFNAFKRPRYPSPNNMNAVLSFLPWRWQQILKQRGTLSKRKNILGLEEPESIIEATSRYLESTQTKFLIQLCKLRFHLPDRLLLQFLNDLTFSRHPDSGVKEYLINAKRVDFPLKVYQSFVKKLRLEGDILNFIDVFDLPVVVPKVKAVRVYHILRSSDSQTLHRLLQVGFVQKLEELEFNFCNVDTIVSALSLPNDCYKKMRKLSLNSSSLRTPEKDWSIILKTLTTSIKAMKHLKYLNFVCNNLADVELAFILEAAKGNKSLQHLSIQDNYVGENSGKALKEVISICPLESLYLNELESYDTPRAISVAFSAIATSQTLTTLVLIDVSITVHTADAIKKCFSVNRSLTNITLQNLSLNLQGTCLLLKGLSQLSTLKALRFKGQYMNRIDSIPLLANLMLLPKLKILDIDFASCGCRQLIHDFFSVLPQSVSLTELKVKRSRLDDITMAFLASIFSSILKSPISRISFNKNLITDIGAQELIDILNCTKETRPIHIELCENLTSHSFMLRCAPKNPLSTLFISRKNKFHKRRALEGLDPYFNAGGV